MSILYFHQILQEFLLKTNNGKYFLNIEQTNLLLRLLVHINLLHQNILKDMEQEFWYWNLIDFSSSLYIFPHIAYFGRFRRWKRNIVHFFHYPSYINYFKPYIYVIIFFKFFKTERSQISISTAYRNPKC